MTTDVVVCTGVLNDVLTTTVGTVVVVVTLDDDDGVLHPDNISMKIMVTEKTKIK
ncbi:MAG: hypothetical protein LUQ66_05395 [Methanoregula sp.]|nr:hypothetical protein [Methanoregula sp.]